MVVSITTAAKVRLAANMISSIHVGSGMSITKIRLIAAKGRIMSRPFTRVRCKLNLFAGTIEAIYFILYIYILYLPSH